MQAATGAALAEADTIYREALEKTPGNPWLLYNYGVFRMAAIGDPQ